MTKTDTPTHGNHDDRKQHGAAGKARGKARAHCDRRAEYTVLATDAGNALPATRASSADGNGLPATIRPEQQRVDRAAAAAKPAKPAKSSKPRKPAKPKRARRPKRRKATGKSKSRVRARKPKPSRKPPIPKFPHSLPGPTDEPTIPAAEQIEHELTDKPTTEQAEREQVGGEHKDEQQQPKDDEPKHKDGDEPKRKDDEPTDAKKPRWTAQQIAEEETCRGHAYDQWAQQIIAKHADAVRENIGSAWPPANPELHEAIARAPDEVARLAEKEATKRGYSLKAADVKRDHPRALWRILKHYWPRYQRNRSPGQYEAFVEETVEHFQGEFLRQEQFRKLDDLDDEEERHERDVWKTLDKVVEKAAREFHLDTATIWDDLIEGFRNHPKLAEIVDDVPGTVIAEIGDEFRVTSDPYSVWARFGARPGQAPGRIVFTWARIFKVALIPVRHSTDLDDKRPWHHFRLSKKQGSRVIKSEVVIPGELVVKGSAPGAAIKYAEYGAKILRFLDWEPTRVVGKRLPGIGWHKTTDDDRDFLLRPDRAVLPSSARAPVPVDHENVDPKIVYELESQAADGWRGDMKGGSAEGWRHHAARHAKDSNAVFGVGVLLAALLLKWVTEWARIYNKWGPQKIGKSAADQIVQSFVGKPYRPGAGPGTFGFSLNATANKVIERALLRSDFGLILDEHGMLAPKDFADLAYKLVSGEEKGRHGRADQSFNTPVLMNGERSFLQLMSDAGLNVMPGQLARLLDIPAQVRRGGVAFESMADRDQVNQESKQIYAWTMQNYGYPGLEWQQHVVDLQAGRIRDESDRGMERWRAIPEVQRVAVPPDYGSVIGGFALPAAALEMAREAKVLPSTWTRETNDACVLACMERWADAQITQERQLREKIVTGLREGLFTFMRKTAGGLVGARPSDAADLAGDWKAQIEAGERWGFVKIDDRHPRICIALDAFEDLCGGRLQALEMANRFLERGWLERDGDRLTKNEMIRDGRTHRCYVLRDAFLLDDAALLAQTVA